MNKHNCRVCGLSATDLPWGEDEKTPTYEICSCCGVEFGNEDYTVESTICYRNKWIEEGMAWFWPKDKPVKWNKGKQFKNIPLEFI